MQVKEFLEKNFTAEKIKDFAKKYQERYTPSAYSQFIRINLAKFNEYRWQLLADHFTGGNVEKIFSMYQKCKQKQESIFPKEKEINLKDVLK